MLKIPKKVVERFAGTLKGYQGVVADIKARDVSEADTVTVAQQRIRKAAKTFARMAAKRENVDSSSITELAVAIASREPVSSTPQ